MLKLTTIVESGDRHEIDIDDLLVDPRENLVFVVCIYDLKWKIILFSQLILD